ncbi:peroxiredoxin [Chitinibacter bivalviorum]|uniref:thioredoxin-dependent peroxiredoxin n=1 Tax=Chitinibacter bivalviorum TaxID=2739434 RepID=A0A7H9BJK8_9NEIS|nr:peroxiredoxin [Chitinibacter bivalviorum]QLG87744.1 peroxiredoxin [Chitinibacter bivalviorum]
MSSAICSALQLPTTNAGQFDLSQLATPYAVIYFYPKDNTPGCTTETADFRDHYTQFIAAGATVYGVSRDSIKSHENFKAKLGLDFELISDPEEVACEAFGVMKLKNMYGKQVRGIERSTFVISASGEILKEWRGVKVPNHVAEVLNFVVSLK